MNNTGPSPQIQVLHHTFHTALNFLFLPFACINLQATHPLCLASPPPNLWYVDKPFKEIASPFVRLNANKHMSRLDQKNETKIDKNRQGKLYRYEGFSTKLLRKANSGDYLLHIWETSDRHLKCSVFFFHDWHELVLFIHRLQWHH
jgi:hypothetical protein